MSKHLWLIRVFVRGKILSALLPLLLPAGTALAGDKEPFAVLELGAAGEWGLNGDGSSFGPTAAIEFTAIKNWLAIEPGVTTLFSRGQTEWDTGDASAHFEIWPTPDRKYGWFLEPSYTYSFGSGHEQSFGVSAGLLIPIE